MATADQTLMTHLLRWTTQNLEPKKRFYRPASKKVNGDSKVYVVDCYRHRVQTYQKVSTLAG